ncbi:MAG: DUF4058 family protein [Thermoanaerobaculia bacterium]
MPSPYPGMDPYLEGSLWTTFHHSLAAEIVRELAPRLRPRYLVFPEERFVMNITDAVSVTTVDAYPDAGVAESEIREPETPYGTTATVPLRLATVVPEPIPHVSVEIRDVAERRLVTAIEILSPTNKRGEGRAEYVSRRQRLLRSTAHLLEIDLLRKGRRVPMQDPLPDEPYFVLLSRAESRPVTEVWPIPFDGPLPAIPVPLLPGDPDADLDLQRIFTQVYDLLGYDLAFDYSRPPEVPLSESQAAWVAENLVS